MSDFALTSLSNKRTSTFVLIEKRRKDRKKIVVQLGKIVRTKDIHFLFSGRTVMGQALGCVQVDQSTVSIKENFGKYNDVLAPGCHFTDNVFVTMVASIQYRALVDKAADAFYKLSNTKEQLQAYVFDGWDSNIMFVHHRSRLGSACARLSYFIGYLLPPANTGLSADGKRATVPTLELDKVFEQKTEIAKTVGKRLTKTLIVDIEPDDQVKSSMNEINAASRFREAAYEKAEREKILQIKQAEGEAKSKYLAGLGIARQRQAIVEGLKASVIGFSTSVPGASTKDVMDMILITQYFDTMKEIGVSSNSSDVFIPHEPEVDS
ncbi:hypothetical protein RND71_002315 [Anisodus tanguticus]|uniref:Band 7 domain-containing protein n=1 Tax=Anisodus tanguticus TaxID=243964 RepID=A0AAE1VRV3_9SOLA|nr:hypothetical protein RND71_002315 [Anisodus tanguticus]